MPPFFRPQPAIRSDLEHRFPNLRQSDWKIKSPFNRDYNCFAWAACDDKNLWAPLLPPYYWPVQAPQRTLTLECFIETFKTMGYIECGNDDSFEFGFQKIAIYADEEDTPTHMARQHFFGCGWLSKLGELEDILHPDLHDVEGDVAATSVEYGIVVRILRRSWWNAARFGLFQGWLAAFRFWLYRIWRR
jgi:hypothetical protein